MKTKFIFTLLLTLITTFSFSQKKAKNTTKTTSTVVNIKISQDIKEIYQKFNNGQFTKSKYSEDYILSIDNYTYKIVLAEHNNFSVIFMSKYNENSKISTFCVFNKNNLEILIKYGQYNSYGSLFKVKNENRYLLEVSKDRNDNSIYKEKSGLYDLSNKKELVSCDIKNELGPTYDEIRSYTNVNNQPNIHKDIYELNSDNTISFRTDSKSLTHTFDLKKNKFINTIGISKSNNNNTSNPCLNSNIPEYEDKGWSGNEKYLYFPNENGGIFDIKITFGKNSKEFYGGTKWHKTESAAIKAEYLYQKYGCH